MAYNLTLMLTDSLDSAKQEKRKKIWINYSLRGAKKQSLTSVRLFNILHTWGMHGTQLQCFVLVWKGNFTIPKNRVFSVNLVHYLCLPPDSVSDINIVHLSKPTSWQYLRTLWYEKIFLHRTVCVLSRFPDTSSFTQSQPPILILRYFFPPLVFTTNFGKISLNKIPSLSLPPKRSFSKSSPPPLQIHLSPFCIIRFIEFFSA